MLAVIEDPIYLTEPELISKSFQPDPNPMSPVGPPCVAGYEGVPEGTACRTILPGTNPSIDELTKLYGIPREAALGGAETMYPEYRKKLKDDIRAAGKMHAELRSASATATTRALEWRISRPLSVVVNRPSCPTQSIPGANDSVESARNSSTMTDSNFATRDTLRTGRTFTNTRLGRPRRRPMKAARPRSGNFVECHETDERWFSIREPGGRLTHPGGRRLRLLSGAAWAASETGVPGSRPDVCRNEGMKKNDGPALAIRLLGGFDVRVWGKPVAETQWPRRQAKQLVKLLALTQGTSCIASS